MPRVKLLGQAITASHGTLETGDIVNVSEAFAAHLVNDCKVAEYLDAAPADPAAAESTDDGAAADAPDAASDPAAADVDQPAQADEPAATPAKPKK